jgi:hypothetical protein
LLAVKTKMKKEVLTHKKYKNAFKCHKCPQTSDETGCPVWWEQVWEEQDTKEQVLTSGCGFTMAQTLLLDVVKQGFGARAEVNEMRKEVVTGVERATVKMLELQRTQEEALSAGDLEGHNFNELRLVRED